MKTLFAALGLSISALALSGCSADYLNHLDTVTLGAGDSVEANLNKETTNPSAGYMYDTRNLGSDGSVIPDKNGGSSGTVVNITGNTTVNTAGSG